MDLKLILCHDQIMQNLRKISRLDGSFKPTAFFILLILSAILIPTLRHWFGNTGFLVQNIEIYPERFRHIDADIWLGQPMYALNLKEIQNTIEIYPEVGNVKIRREPPHTIRIDISPAKPLAILDAGKRYVVDANGKIIRPAQERDEYPIIRVDGNLDPSLLELASNIRPILKWIPTSSITTGQQVPKTAHLKLLGAQEFLQITVDDIIIDMGSPPYDKKWTQLSKVLPYIKDRKQGVSHILMGEDPNNVVIRP